MVDYIDFVFWDCSLFGGSKLCIHRISIREFLVWELHVGGLAGHFGRDKTIALVEDMFYWPSLKWDVARTVSLRCTSQLVKVEIRNTGLLYTCLFDAQLGRTSTWILSLDCLELE